MAIRLFMYFREIFRYILVIYNRMRTRRAREREASIMEVMGNPPSVLK